MHRSESRHSVSRRRPHALTRVVTAVAALAVVATIGVAGFGPGASSARAAGTTAVARDVSGSVSVHRWEGWSRSGTYVTTHRGWSSSRSWDRKWYRNWSPVTTAPAPTTTPEPTATPTPSATPEPTATPTPSATPEPTATPAPAPTTAAPVAPTAPAAPPPTTTGFPDASSTGVPAGVSLSPYTGPSTITAAGTVIDGKLITKPLVIAASASNVTIKNSRIAAQGFWLVLNDAGAKNLQIIDTEMDGRGNTSNDAAVAGRNYTLTRVNIHSTVDGLKLGDNVTVQDSYIHDLVVSGDSHNDGMQSLGSNDVLIRHNTIIAPKASTSAIILSTGSADSMRRITIDNNLLGGGAYTVYGGYQVGVDILSRVSDITVSNNRITTAVNPQGGAYGPFTSVSKPAVTMTGNVWHDGPNAGRAIS